jgi:hypothetical protein
MGTPIVKPSPNISWAVKRLPKKIVVEWLRNIRTVLQSTEINALPSPFCCKQMITVRTTPSYAVVLSVHRRCWIYWGEKGRGGIPAESMLGTTPYHLMLQRVGLPTTRESGTISTTILSKNTLGNSRKKQNQPQRKSSEN